MDKHFEDNDVSRFLDQVTDQIAYRPLRPSIRRELADHLEDRTQDYEADGMSHEEAVRQALRHMGDAATIGTELNAAHQLRRAPALAAISALLLLIGFAYSAYMQWSPELSANGFLHYLPGIVLLCITAMMGYPLFVRHWKILAYLTGLLYVALIALSVYFTLGSDVSPAFYKLDSLSYYASLLLGPIAAIWIYHNCSRLKWSTLAAVLGIGVWIVLIRRLIYYVNSAAIAILLLTVFGTVCFMVHRDILPGRKWRLYGGCLACLALLGSALWISPSERYDLQAFVAPQSVICSTWDDAYNGVLIQELLARTPLMEGIELTPEEMIDYGSGAWYFNGETSDRQRKNFRSCCDESNVTLWQILPQHYYNNYLIALCILLFGWLPGMAMVGLILAFYGILFGCIVRIRGKLASSIAISCGLCLLWQSVFYLLGNFGYQYSGFTNLPLISEGWLSITFNMLLLGLVFSAYRFDRVVEEPSGLKPSVSA